VVAALATMTCYFTLPGVPALVLSIVALTRADRDPDSCRRLTRIGWTVFGVGAGLIAIGILAVLVAIGITGM
jgi:hypothetical protein